MDKEVLQKIWSELLENELISYLGIEPVELGKDFITLKMPVTSRVTQIDGILHGGITFALAETVGSVGAYVLYRKQGESIRGIELSGNHLRAGKVGDTIFAKATCIHNGGTLQLWDIKATNQHDKLISSFKFTTIKI